MVTETPAGQVTAVGIVGSGRAGSSFATVLTDAGWQVTLLGHDRTTPEALTELAATVDLILLCVPDTALAGVVALFPAGALGDRTVLAHCSGAAPLTVLAGATRTASIHPLVALNGSNPRDLIGAWYAVAGDPLARRLAAALEGRIVEVADRDRPLYHAGAVLASNHLVALLAQVESVATTLGLPLDAYLDLARGALASTGRLGPTRALTGPVSRGDLATVAGHLRALEEAGLAGEVDAYLALARRATQLAGRDPAELDRLAAAD